MPANLFAWDWVAVWRPREGPPGEPPAGLDLLTSIELPQSAGRLDLWIEPGSEEPEWETSPQAAVIFAGALHEREDLRRRLGLGDADRPTCDAGLVLLAYERLGDRALEVLRGRFAFLHVDRHGAIRLVRDPVGDEPLYFHAGPSGLLAASPSVFTLQRLPEVPVRVDRVVVAAHLCYVGRRLEETFFEEIERVPGGHELRFRAGDARLRRYWDPMPQGRDDWVTRADLEEFEADLGAAVRRSLEGRRPAIFLSAGLDSVSVALMAAEIQRETGQPPPLALCLGFPPPADEEAAQRAAAEAIGLPQIARGLRECVGEAGLVRRALEESGTRPAPLQNLWTPAYRVLGELGRQAGCEAVLTGNGGDEWLGVSPYHAADLIRHGRLGSFVHFFRATRRSYELTAWQVTRNVIWRYGLRPIVAGYVVDGLRALSPRLESRFLHWRGARGIHDWVAPDPAVREELRARASQIPVARPLNGSHYLGAVRRGLDSPLEPLEMEEFLVSGRRMGLRMRHPYWDAPLNEKLCRVPPDLLLDGGQFKSPAREAVGRRMSRTGIQRLPKVYATTFFRSVVDDEGTACWNDLGGLRALAEQGMVAGELGSGALPRDDPRRSWLNGGRLWYLLSSEYWLREQRSRLV